MELQGERTIPAPRERTWAALNDPQILKACITGCESLEREGENGLLALVAVRVGPVSARFKGKLQLADVVPQVSYTIHFDGQGGVAGFGKGSADVKLSDAGPGRTTLAYVARAQVGGKLAQIGSRLVDAAAGKIAEDFFQAFEAQLRAETGDVAHRRRRSRRHLARAAGPRTPQHPLDLAGPWPCSSGPSSSTAPRARRPPWTAWTCKCCNRRATGAPKATPCGWSP
jgi:carbon monoxide dehydrogenase subunit G